ncbi:ATP-binding protein [Fibrella sp. WM1]|uniref:ATP-binding protein n=1 Tax=Fibrella musci TaxID=3242485 RepID=UPI003521323F
MNFPVLGVTLFLLFQVRQFLNTKERKPTWDRWLTWSAYGLIGLFVLDQIGEANGKFEVRATWVAYVVQAWIIYLTYIGSRRYPPARTLLLAMVPFWLVLVTYSLVKLALPTSVFKPYSNFFESALGFGYVWVFSIFFFASKQRKTYRKEVEERKEKEEQERRERHLLEELVQERTQELTQQKAELSRQKEELQAALNELRATQDQLVQREKLASLGELTAGIAHEIQNPLNFVNNFSEVSVDLLHELQEERTRPAPQRDAGLEEELLSDLVQNLSKIQHHGQRASGIVRSMLQHSRSSTGQREPTDLNALAEEYLRLSYHGLRAKDKAFNASFEAVLDPGLPLVSVVGQDIGRVLLNLFNNAFYAVQQRQQAEREKDTLVGLAYRPFVKITTQQTPVGVEIKVADNGTGVPEDLQQKIFQPFFTTKPSGSGTGLGLSLSYDIITKGHNGTMQVESIEGKGTTFTILLPAV